MHSRCKLTLHFASRRPTRFMTDSGSLAQPSAEPYQHWPTNDVFPPKDGRFGVRTLHSDKDHQTTFVCGPITHTTNPRWRTAAILKNRKIAISRQQFRRFRPNLARRHTSNFENPRWRQPPSWIIGNGPMSGTVWSISTKFSVATQFVPLEPSNC